MLMRTRLSEKFHEFWDKIASLKPDFLHREKREQDVEGLIPLGIGRGRSLQLLFVSPVPPSLFPKIHSQDKCHSSVYLFPLIIPTISGRVCLLQLS